MANKDEKPAEQTNEQDQVKQKPESKRNPVRITTLIVLSICVLFFIWYLASSRHTPYTTSARLNALTVPIVPYVSGYLKKADVRLHSQVKKGDTMFLIDPRPFEIAVKSAEASVDKATQRMGTRGASVKAAAGRLGVANAQLDRAQRNYNRVMQVFKENPGALSLSDRDAAETALASATEQVASAQADLEKAQQSLGVYGPDNADLRAAIAKLEQAQMNLAFTVIPAPSDGFIESYNLDVGFYCGAGAPIATFISTGDVWIQAEYRENSLEHIKVGERADFVLDMAPGRRFTGKVRSVGYAVSSDQDVNRGGLPTVQSESGWLREPQRFPVIITIEDTTVMKHFRIGGQVDVVVYSERYSFLNTLARFRLWLNSKLSYVR
jgi:multidrug resistance efflux pump